MCGEDSLLDFPNVHVCELRSSESNTQNELTFGWLSLHGFFMLEINCFMQNFSRLPDDLILEILSHIPDEPALLGSIAKVNRLWRTLSLTNFVRSTVRMNEYSDHARNCSFCEGIDQVPVLLYEAVRNARFSCVRYCISMLPTHLLSQPEPDGRTLLHHATSDVRILRYLVDEVRLAELCTRRARDGLTPLHEAARCGHLDSIKYFVEEMGLSAFCAHKDDRERTILHLAGASCYLNVVRYIVGEVEMSSLCFERDEHGCTILHTAAEMNDLRTVKYLVEERGLTDLCSRVSER
eukprot:Rmarinus@m.11603